MIVRRAFFLERFLENLWYVDVFFFSKLIKPEGDILMSVTIRPGFATIPLAENGFGMDFSAFSSERAHK